MNEIEININNIKVFAQSVGISTRENDAAMAKAILEQIDEMKAKLGIK